MSAQVWDVKAVLEWMTGYLEEHGDEHPRLSAEWLMCAATELSRIEIYMNYDRPLSSDERAFLRAAVKRRAAGEPLQYVTGEVAFRHIVLKVARGVLIPRPETELLVEHGIAFLAERGGEPAALDLCTGSGCIALSLASECPGLQVTATDLSAAAIEQARRNVEALGLEERVTVLQGDLFAALEGAAPTTPDVDPAGPEDLRFDLIISNPPYIPSAELAALPAEVADFEPALALDGGPDGLDLFRRIAAEAPRFLKPGGALMCELHETTLEAAAAIAAPHFACTRIERDLAGRDRFLIALL